MRAVRQLVPVCGGWFEKLPNGSSPFPVKEVGRGVATVESENSEGVWNQEETTGFLYLREMPALRIRARKVLGFMPRSTAAPFFPSMRQAVFWSTWRM